MQIVLTNTGVFKLWGAPPQGGRQHVWRGARESINSETLPWELTEVESNELHLLALL